MRRLSSVPAPDPGGTRPSRSGFLGRLAWTAAAALVWASGCAAPSAETEPPAPRAPEISRPPAATPRYREVSEAFHRSLQAILADSRAVASRESRSASVPHLSPSAPAKPARNLPRPVREGNPGRFYKKALALYRTGDYERSRNGFLAFLERFPDHSLADNARYWIGECYYAQGLYREAGVSFRRVLVDYDDANKTPDAFFKLGLCYHRRGRAEEARTYWERLVRRYPGSRAAALARKHLR